jgi:hypothetical protein
MIITAPFYVSFIIFTPLFCVYFLPSFVTLFPSTFRTTRSAGLFLSSLYCHAFHCFRLWFLPRSDAGRLLSAVTVSEVTYLFTPLTYLFSLADFHTGLLSLVIFHIFLSSCLDLFACFSLQSPIINAAGLQLMRLTDSV